MKRSRFDFPDAISIFSGHDINFTGLVDTNVGFSQLAAAILAVDHFNSRNTSVVSELAHWNNCSVHLELAQFFDTETRPGPSVQQFVEHKVPCGIVGPFHDIPAQQLSTFALGHRIPLVVSRAFDIMVVSSYQNNFTSQTYPDLVASATAVIKALEFFGRTDYVGFLHTPMIPNIQRREFLSYSMQLHEHFDHFVTASFFNTEADYVFSEVRPAYTALSEIHDAGYRTIVVAFDVPYQELQAVADAAEALEMNNGDYFWLFYDNLDLHFLGMQYLNANISKLVQGSAFLVPFAENDAFQSAWKTRNDTERLNALNPISPAENGYRCADPDFFQRVEILFGSGTSTSFILGTRCCGRNISYSLCR